MECRGSAMARMNLTLLLFVSLMSLLHQVPGAYAYRGIEISSASPGRSLAAGRTAAALSLAQEAKVLLSVKARLQDHNPGRSSVVAKWKEGEADPCKWPGVGCSDGPEGTHVTSIDVSSQNFGGPLPLQPLANLTYLSSLSMATNAFVDSIPPEVGLLSSISRLDLSNNQLSGAIPASLGSLPSLTVLDLSYNVLLGGVPEELFVGGATCGRLQSLNLSSNEQLGGEVPASISGCRALEQLDLSNCSLGGSIPSGIGRLTGLKELVLRGNKFVGDIPADVFSSCQNLESLDMALNNLTGPVPSSIANCSKLRDVALSGNQLEGLPKEIGLLAPTLERLLISHNMLEDLPDELGSCTKLKVLTISGNSLAGNIPQFISGFQQLEFLSLYSNSFTGELPAWLGGLSSLRHLDASNNELSGQIPAEITGLSAIQFLLLASNKISGWIPDDIGNMANLQVLDISSNFLVGGIPPTIGRLGSLLWLMLANNELEGEVPVELGNCSSLLWLNAMNNKLSGQLPDSLANIGANVNATFALNIKTLPLIPKPMGECNAVKRWIPSHYPPFDLISNVMTLERCRNFWNLLMRGVFMYPLCPSRPPTQSMGYIQLSMNRFTGQIPRGLAKCTHLGLLFLDRNNLTGTIPLDGFAGALTGLNVSRNMLTGEVPHSIGSLTCLVSLDLSYNNLSGRIPPELQNLTQLNRFNISFNPELVGPILTGQQFSTFGASIYEGDVKLCADSSSVAASANNSSSKISPCGATLDLSSPSQRNPTATGIAIATIVGISLACTLGLIVLVLLGFCLLGKAPPTDANALEFMMVGGKEHRHFIPDNAASVQVSLFSVELPKHLTYSDLVSATSNFDEQLVVGSGGFGIVYKAKLADGSTVAIKKLIQEGPQADREFLAEMETLGHLHHENLVPLLGCSSCGTQKLLVYKYMEKGSLDDWLHERPGGAEALEWPIRLNIALGIARGLKFLHHNCSPPVVHRDMKASNILLDVNFEPRLTDFGLARVLGGAQETHVSTVVAGTLGYVPPEYCQTWRATTKGDVYSFGVVLLELVTGRRPMSICFGEKDSGGNLIEWAAYHVKKGIANEVCDSMVTKAAAPGEILAFLRLAVCCTAELPVRRPTMREVLRILEEIKAGNYTAMMLTHQSSRGHG